MPRQRRWRGIFLRLLRPLLRLKGSKVDRLRALMESCGFLICGRGTNGQPLIPARRVGKCLYPPKDFRAWANRPTWPTPRHGKPPCKGVPIVYCHQWWLPMRVQALTGPYCQGLASGAGMGRRGSHSRPPGEKHSGTAFRRRYDRPLLAR